MKKTKKTPTLKEIRSLDNQVTRLKEQRNTKALAYAVAKCPFQIGDLIESRYEDGTLGCIGVVTRIEPVYNYYVYRGTIQDIRWGMWVWPFRKDKKAQVCMERKFIGQRDATRIKVISDPAKEATDKVRQYRKIGNHPLATP